MGLLDDLPSLGCLVDVLPKEQRLTCLEFSSLSPTCMPNIFVRARFTSKKQANQPVCGDVIFLLDIVNN